jgi:hypothetical protein
MKTFNAVLFVSLGLVSFGQSTNKDEIKRAKILENPENYIQQGGVLSDELLKDKLPEKTLRADFVIHPEMKVSNDQGLEKIKSAGEDYDSAKAEWIEQNKNLYNEMQKSAPEKYLTPEERMSIHKK